MSIFDWLKKPKTAKYKKELGELKRELESIQKRSGEKLEKISAFLENPVKANLRNIDFAGIKKILLTQQSLEISGESHINKAGKIIDSIISKSRSSKNKLEQAELELLSELEESLNSLKTSIYQQMWYFDLKSEDDLLQAQNIAALKRSIAEEVSLLGAEAKIVKKLNAEAELENTAENRPFERGTRKLLLPNGRELLFKPERIQEPYHVIKYGQPTGDIIPSRNQVLNEVAASIIDEEIGFNIVPKTRTKTLGSDFGSLRDFVGAAVTADKWFIEHDVTEQLKQQIVFKRALDYLINNQDVHLGNWLVTTDTEKVVAIDNANAFVEGDDPELLSAVIYSKVLEEKLRSVNDSRLRSRLLALGIQEDFVDGFFVRKEKLLEHLKRIRK